MPTDDRANYPVEVFENKRDSPMVVVSYDIIPRMPPALSAAEGEVVRMIMKGRSNAQIADARGTAVNTIANQVAEVFRKLEVNTRSELALRLCEICPGCDADSCRDCAPGRP